MDNIFYISPNFNNNDNNKFNNIDSCINYINNDVSVKNGLIKLYPGDYYTHFHIKKPVIIEGQKFNTNLIINDCVTIECNSVFKNLDIKLYGNKKKLLDKIFYINIDFNTHDLVTRLNENNINLQQKKVINNNLIFENVNLSIINSNQSSIFLLENGKLKFKFSKINFIQDKISNTKIIFNSHINTFISLYHCQIDSNSINVNLIIFNSNMSDLYLNNTTVKKNIENKNYKINSNEKNYIINNYYSVINIEDSKFINNEKNGSIINFIDDPEFIKDINIKNLKIDSNKIKINITSDNYLDILSLIKLNSVIINQKKYFFKNYDFSDGYIEIYMNNYKNDENNNNTLIQNFKIQFLYNTKIINSTLYETSTIDNYSLNNYFPKNYGLVLVNTYIKNFTNELCNIELNEESKLKGVKINVNGSIITSNSIKSQNYLGNGQNIENINFKKYKEGIKSGFRIETKELNKGNIGNNSIDMTFISRDKNINISKEKYGIMGDLSFGIGINNIVLGKNNFIGGFSNKITSDNSFVYGNNLILDENGVFMLGKYNIESKSNVNKLFVIGNGDEENKSDGLIFYENGDLKIQGKVECDRILVNDLNIENNNINNLDNISVNENIFCDGDLFIEGTLNGKIINKNKNLKISILNNHGIIETKLELKLENFKRTKIDGGIIGNNKLSYLLNLDENKNGILYKMIIICIEEPDFNDIRFIESQNDKLNINSHNFDFTDIICNQNWKKGLYKEIELHNFDLEDKYLYICRMDNFTKYNKTSINKEKIFSKGKFLIKLLGGNKF